MLHEEVLKLDHKVEQIADTVQDLVELSREHQAGVQELRAFHAATASMSRELREGQRAEEEQIHLLIRMMDNRNRKHSRPN